MRDHLATAEEPRVLICRLRRSWAHRDTPSGGALPMDSQRYLCLPREREEGRIGAQSSWVDHRALSGQPGVQLKTNRIPQGLSMSFLAANPAGFPHLFPCLVEQANARPSDAQRWWRMAPFLWRTWLLESDCDGGGLLSPRT
jgi:hypothetical protein